METRPRKSKRLAKTYTETCDDCGYRTTIIAIDDREAIRLFREAGWDYAIERNEKTSLFCKLCVINRRIN